MVSACPFTLAPWLGFTWGGGGGGGVVRLCLYLPMGGAMMTQMHQPMKMPLWMKYFP